MYGKVLGNRYEIIEKIGGGGMAVVYKAKDKVLNRFVAIKILRQEFINDQDFIEKFRQESLSAASLTHPNIVSIYDTGEEKNIYYIVMEYVKGMTLKKYINKKGSLYENEAIDITIQIAEALKHAHSNNVIHRDIKPHNILLTDEGVAKVADFGIARAATSSTINNTSNVIGSVHYFSPEQARGGYVDEKSDIYSLGIVMYEMITGEVPFNADNHVAVALKHVNERVVPPTLKNSKISKELERIILKCLKKQQSYRYKNITELINDIKKIPKDKINQSINTEDNISDSPTIIIPKIKDELSIKTDPEKEKAFKKFFSDDENNEILDEEKESNKKSSKIKTTIIATLLALAITAIITVFAFNYLKDYLTVDEVVVPSLIGKSEQLAEEELDKLGLVFSVKDRVYNSKYSEGIIIKQNIKQGEVLRKDFPISVIVSKGEKYVIVPSLFKKYSNEADMLLSDAELEEGDTTYEFSSDIPWGLVIRQSPEAGKEVVAGTVVSYVISKGPEVEYSLMPNLVGKNIDEAKTIIKDKGFEVGEITPSYDEEYGKGIVIYQSYPFGQEVEVNTSIDLIVSDGKDPNTPSTTEQAIDSEENGEDSEGNNEELSTAQISIELPTERESVMVTVERVLDDGKQSVYQERHNTSEKRVDVNVQGRGEQQYEIYIDGELIETIIVKFN